MQRTKYLIVGASAAGISAANFLARQTEEGSVTCVSAELQQPYNKCFLVDWLTKNKSLEELNLKLDDLVKLELGLRVNLIDVASKVAHLSDGKSISYEKLLLAMGSKAFYPPIKGLTGAQNLFAFHSWDDLARLSEFIEHHKPRQAVVIGAGLTGLECADALWQLGMQVTVCEAGSQLLGRLLDCEASSWLADHIQALGVQVFLNRRVVELYNSGLRLDSGEALAADLIILAAGVRPNQIQFSQAPELKADYFLVDREFRTNLDQIWAAGDLLLLPDLLTGELIPSCSWPDAMQQGRLAAQSMLGQPKPYPGLLSIAKSRFFDLEFVSFGQIQRANNLYHTEALKGYRKCVISPAGRVIGTILLGDLADYPRFRQSALTGQPIN